MILRIPSWKSAWTTSICGTMWTASCSWKRRSSPATSPPGTIRIASMTTDTYLVGPTWNDHVDYWMPFDGQIGLHDSSWRTEYGGDIYLTDGSHGCVNTPLDAMATIYNNITVGTLVVVY